MRTLLHDCRNPLRACKFLYTWVAASFLVVLTTLLPHYPVHQNLRTRLQRAYLSSASLLFPDLIHRLPVAALPASQARLVEGPARSFKAYLIPGEKTALINSLVLADSKHDGCVILYAHGGGYARGEARMYLNYTKRWDCVAADTGLDLIFLSVEYPLTDSKPHPAQRDAFLGAYKHLLELGLPAKKIVFMGDSAAKALGNQTSWMMSSTPENTARNRSAKSCGDPAFTAEHLR